MAVTKLGLVITSIGLWLVFTITISGEETKCPNDYVVVKNLCLHVSTSKGHYLNAVFFCIKSKGKLVSFNNAQQINSVSKYLETQNLNENAYWIGLSNLDGSGSWIWNFADGQVREAKYTQWCDEEGDITNNSLQCAYLDSSTKNPCFRVTNCSDTTTRDGKTLYFICEAKERKDSDADLHFVG